MEPVFTLPYSEFCVAQRLQRLFPSSAGYSTYVPMSRQQPGVDLVLVRRRRGRTMAATIQVKSSRTYSRRARAVHRVTRFRYYTWFSAFKCSENADFYCLIALYPAVDARQRRELGSWWSPMILVFSQREMRKFLAKVKTVGGKRDRMFGFGFDSPEAVYQTRGDRLRRFLDFSEHVLERRTTDLQRFLDPRSRS